MILLHVLQPPDKYLSNGDWNVRSVSIKNRLMTYSCCKYPFSDVTYTFVLDRKPGYHVLYLIVPCVIISFVALTTFYLPPDCGERVGMSVTALLAMTMYLLIVSDILPETSDFVPRLGLYYMVVMGEIALILAATAITLRCHYSRSKPPRFLLRFRRQHKAAVKPKRLSNAVLAVVDLFADSKEIFKSFPTIEPEINVDDTQSDENDKDSWAECWKDFARRLDIIFFVLFSILFLTSTLTILLLRKAD